MQITTAAVPSEGGHWYDRQGRMVEMVPGAKGQMVKPDIRHARKLGLLPGVTTVNKVLSSPALTEWLVKQALESALTLPRIEGESLDAFLVRARHDSKETGRKAADRGTDLHTALERAAEGKPFDERWSRHVEAVDTNLRFVGIEFRKCRAEKSFAHPLGYGGKNDGHNESALWDYKSKDEIEAGKKYAYDDQIQQLTACREGLELPADTRLLNVYIGVKDAKVLIHEWEPEDRERGWEMFQHALAIWQLRNRYASGFIREAVAA